MTEATDFHPPWKADDEDVFGDNYVDVMDARGVVLAHNVIDLPTGRMMAAAPDLYEALEDAWDFITKAPAYGFEPVVAKISAALAKARGE